MKLNETIEQRARQPICFKRQKTNNYLRMTSTTARYPLKPKTLTLLEICQSISDFRHPPPAITSYQYQSSSNSTQVLTRRLYLHPITINSNSKQSSSKNSSNTTILTPSDHEQRYQFNLDKNHIKTKSSHHGLAILSTSLPLITRINPKHDNRFNRDKISFNNDDDTNSDYDTSSTTISLNQFNLPTIARGTSSSTHTLCTRPSCVMNYQKNYSNLKRWEKVNVWNNFDRALQRPIPIDPPTTPFDNNSDYNINNNEFEYQ